MLDWKYDKRTLDIFMPGYIVCLLQKYARPTSSKPHHFPYAPAPKKYGGTTQETIPEDESPHLDKNARSA